MAKKVKTINSPAGAPPPPPPVGTALGPHGLPIMEFVQAFNERTADQKGNIIPAVITVYEDRTFSFIIKKPPVAEMIKKSLGRGGSQKPGKEPAGTLSKSNALQIAKDKMDDLKTDDVDEAVKIVEGTA